MSRTFVHRPYHVQQADPALRHRWYRFQMWSTEPPTTVPTYRTHNCWTCTGDRRWAQREHRRQRYTWKRQLRRGDEL